MEAEAGPRLGAEGAGHCSVAANWRSLRQVLRVRDFVVHPEYTGSWAGADIAVVRLARAAVLGPAVQPACLPFLVKKANFAGQPVQVLGKRRSHCVPDPIALKLALRPRAYSCHDVAGWGSQQLDGPSSIRLMAATLKVVKNSACSKAYGWNMTDNHICAFRRDASPCTVRVSEDNRGIGANTCLSVVSSKSNLRLVPG